MRDSIFGEFQYFIKRINTFRTTGHLPSGETIEDLEQRFRVQIERGLVIDEPDAQEIVAEILLSDLSEEAKKNHIIELRKTGKTNFKISSANTKIIQSQQGLTLEQKKERTLDLIIASLKEVGVKAQKQPLAVKMFMAEYELGSINYDDPKDLKLLLVTTVQMSGHAKKADPLKLATTFNNKLQKL